MKFVGRTQEVEMLRKFRDLSAKVEAFFAKHPGKRELKRTLGLLSLKDM